MRYKVKIIMGMFWTLPAFSLKGTNQLIEGIVTEYKWFNLTYERLL